MTSYFNVNLGTCDCCNSCKVVQRSLHAQYSGLYYGEAGEGEVYEFELYLYSPFGGWELVDTFVTNGSPESQINWSKNIMDYIGPECTLRIKVLFGPGEYGADGDIGLRLDLDGFGVITNCYFPPCETTINIPV